MEIFNIVKEILTLIIAGAGVVIAGMALHTWKKEFIGKKKIDLACDIVEQICNIQDIIRYARNPAFFTSESNKITKDFNKDKEEFKENKIHYLAAKYRFYNKKEEINDFFKLRNKAQLYWDKNILNLFNNLNEIIVSINTAAELLYESNDLDFKSRVEFEKKIWWNFQKDDEIERNVQKIVDEFKLNLKDFYEYKLTKWKKLK